MEQTAREATVYDFVHPGHKLAVQWPILDLVNGQAANSLAAHLGSRLQFKLKSSANASEHVKYTEFVDELTPTMLVHEVSMAPLGGVMWVCVDASVVFALVDAYFGGHGTIQELEQMRVMSGTERRVLRHVLDALLESLAQGWSSVAPVQPSLVQFVQNERLGRSGRGQIVVRSDWSLSWSHGEGLVRLVYPHAMLEPIGPKLERDQGTLPRIDSAFSSSLGQELMLCEIDLHGVVGETRMTLADLLAMQPGDFIPLRDVQTVSFKTREMPLFDATLGVSNGQVSASLSEWHLQADQ